MKKFLIAASLFTGLTTWAEEAPVRNDGVTLSADFGSFGGLSANTVGVRIPVVNNHFALRLRHMTAWQGATSGNTTIFGERLEFVFQSPILANHFRVYGAPGVQYSYTLSGEKISGWSGGGLFGFEAFYLPNEPKRAVYFEIGSGSPTFPSFAATSSGFIAVAGVSASF